MILLPEVKGDQPLLLKEPKTKIVMTEITRTLADFQTFAAEHSVSLVRININELMNKLAKHGRLRARDGLSADVVWGSLDSSVMAGFRRKLINLMTLSVCSKYIVNIHVHILYLQIFSREDSQSHEVDMGKQV